MILSARPNWLTAATESPPPTTVVPLQSATAFATSCVPPANAGNSNTPMGPFQITVFAFDDPVAEQRLGLRPDVHGHLPVGDIDAVHGLGRRAFSANSAPTT